ncbi:MAG TPA: DUF6508 domain-containing protein [Candidatus Limnocylindria bacterium]|nr:DUF6508 domain-containing protein [Candidatus Limnocylindria bacterium]
MATDDVGRLRTITRHLAAFEAPGASFGDWARPATDADGVIQVGWYQPSPMGEAFLRDARPWIVPFDWPAWAQSPAGERLLGHPEAVASASAEELRKLLTVYVRSERFGDGTLENVFKSGMLTAIVRRAAILAEEGVRD